MIDKILGKRTRLAVAVVLSATAGSCGAGWRQTNLNTGQLAPRQQVQIWHDGSVSQWHHVRITLDSVMGIPYHLPAECDSCQLSLPRSSVDSARLGNPVAGFWKSFGLVVGSFFAVCLAVCRNPGN